MKRCAALFFNFLFIVILWSCNGQRKAVQNEGIKQPTLIPQTTDTQKSINDYDPYFYESENIKSSFGPESITRNIIQDSNGHMWMASWEGIIRYDGKSFINYTNKDSLRRYHVFSVFEDSRGVIWFGTIGAGIYKYDPQLEKEGQLAFTNITTKEGLVNDNIGCIYEDKKGRIWFGTMGGASCYDSVKNTFRNFTVRNGLSNNDINAIIEDDEGRFWFGTRGAACCYEETDNMQDVTAFTRLEKEDGSEFVNVRSIIIDESGEIWLGGNDGLWSFRNGTFLNYSNSFVGYIYEDSNENIWTGSVSQNSRNWELSRYDKVALPISVRSATHIKDQEGQLFGITEAKNGDIWYGHERGVCKFKSGDLSSGLTSLNCFENI